MKRIGVALAVFLTVLACSSPEPGEARLRIGLMPKLVGIPYFNACETGAREAAEELGVELVYDGPDTADSNRQVEILNSWIVRGFDVLAVAPNNPEAVAPILQRARRRGLRVISWDTDAAPEAREYFCNQIANQEMGRALVEILAAEAGDSARVSLVSGTETASNQNAWMAAMREYAAVHYPEMVFVDPVEYPGEDDARAYQSASGVLKRPDPPGAIVGLTSVSAPAVAKAVSDAGLTGRVVVTGVALPSAMRRYVKDGTVRQFVLWKPVDLGYLAVYAGVQLARGELKGDSIDAGRLGRLSVQGTEILLGPPLVFDAGNIDQFDF